MSTDFYPPLNLKVITPQLELRGATDELLAQLLPIVRGGVITRPPDPFDDPMSLYEDNPLRERKWLQAIWRGRGNVHPDSWRLYFVVMLNGQAVGMQDLIGVNFDTCRTVTSFSWLAPSARQRGLGREMRAAILHLAFGGFGAGEANSEAFFDNSASNRVSESMGYQPNGTDWATRRGEPAVLNRWRLEREDWEPNRRSDIELVGVDECKAVLYIE
ncbi:GNAT family N-acetyltransferase [Deinococcus detaillensis]|uniref:GNAT family N-acetyltransferase n=1 Tax=Deinococcus detaillensis TaxID=2592048 RepID=A0A553V6N9_9DEIO|nr:GNAT family protein [Deinococcus detaillensis]TSA88102.1 GNAT family N-acetyltransferase [Deinococcus detaillensis]